MSRFLKAAEIIFDDMQERFSRGENSFAHVMYGCCGALGKANASYDENKAFKELMMPEYKELLRFKDDFVVHLAKNGEGDMPIWWFGSRCIQRNQEARIMALLFMHEITKRKRKKRKKRK